MHQGFALAFISHNPGALQITINKHTTSKAYRWELEVRLCQLSAGKTRTPPLTPKCNDIIIILHRNKSSRDHVVRIIPVCVNCTRRTTVPCRNVQNDVATPRFYSESSVTTRPQQSQILYINRHTLHDCLLLTIVVYDADSPGKIVGFSRASTPGCNIINSASANFLIWCLFFTEKRVAAIFSSCFTIQSFDFLEKKFFRSFFGE